MRQISFSAVGRVGVSPGMRLLTIGALSIAAACAVVSAQAQSAGAPPPMMAPGGSPHHMAHGMDRMLDGVGATDAQRAQIKQIFQAAAADLKGQHEAGRALREKQMQIFAAPTVDAAAAESVRQQMQGQHDAVSKRMLQAMLDASKLLTPEQRAKMGANMKNGDGRMHDRMQRGSGTPRPAEGG